MTSLSSLRTKRAILVVTFSALILAFGIYVYGIHKVDPQTLDQAIRDNLPNGTDQLTVAKFLEARHIEHSEYLPERRLMVGGIPKSSIGMVRGQIYLEFKFDENGKLSDHKVVEILHSFWP